MYDYYKNLPTPHNVHFSFNNQDGFEQKEIQQSQKNNQYDQTKKQPIYINHQLEKITDSKLVMFSPPKVESIQQPLKEGAIDELELCVHLVHETNRHRHGEE